MSSSLGMSTLTSSSMIALDGIEMVNSYRTKDFNRRLNCCRYQGAMVQKAHQFQLRRTSPWLCSSPGKWKPRPRTTPPH